MQSGLCLIAAALTLMALQGVCPADDEREGKRLKGVELYSWQDEDKHWVFVMLNGTNRNKSEAEVKGAEGRIKGAADLKKALSRLAVGEQASWTHRIKGFEIPSDDTRKEIQKAADEAKVRLDIATSGSSCGVS